MSKRKVKIVAQKEISEKKRKQKTKQQYFLLFEIQKPLRRSLIEGVLKVSRLG